ncbi:MAG: BON domain-containing protein [Planctomycetaceae bacterium]|nr:BON domain-containing protein [Planctomycetaceae bacterium]
MSNPAQQTVRPLWSASSLRFLFGATFAFAVLQFQTNSAHAQQVNLGGTGSTNGSSTGSTGTGTSGTSSGATGFTLNTTNVDNAPQGFVGGAQQDGFVGAIRESTLNTNSGNRQFRAITDQQTNRNLQTQQTGTPRTVPVSIRLGFATPSAGATSNSFPEINSASLDLFSIANPAFSSIRVSMTDAGVATLSGTASSPDVRRLAGNLIRLQPGVRKVNNQVAVAADESTQAIQPIQ